MTSSSPDRVEVLIAEDEQPLRLALTDLIEGEPDLSVVSCAASADEAIAVAEATRPAVALLDVKMPGGGGRRAAAEIRERSPGTAIVALTAYEDRATVVDMLRAGAMGYLVKGTPPEEILDAIRRAARGQASLSATVVASVIDELMREADERELAEQVLRRGEARVRNLLESAPDAVLIVGADGRVVLANARAEQLFGYDRADLVGAPVDVLIPRGLRGGAGMHGRRRNGTEFPVEVSLSELETEEGRLATAFIRDVTDRSIADEQRRESEQRLEALLLSAPDAVLSIDESGQIVLANDRAEEMFGYSRDELLGRGIDSLVPERFRARHQVHRSHYFEDPKTRAMGAGLELAGLRRDGSEFPVDISLSAVDVPDGRLATAFIRDITERKRAEKSEQRFGALLESAPDAVVIIDGDGTVVLVNGQTESLFGYRRGELLGKPVETLLPERFHARHVGHRTGYLGDPRTRPMGAGLDLAGRRKDGTEFPVDISLSSIETDEGPLLTAFVRDITERAAADDLRRTLHERRALLEHLVTAEEEERRRIAGDIHDDSIQAMTAAGMRLQILRRALGDPEQTRLLDDLEGTMHLAISRLRHLLFELRPPALDNEGLVPALRMYLDEAAADGEGPRLRLEDKLRSQPSARARVLLYRIAQEAITNARKHANAEDVIVTVEEHQDGYRLRVTDDGIGFDAAAAQPRAGHLGLVAMRERAELAGGWLRTRSEMGAGTTVDLWIPRHDEGELGE